MDEEFEHIKIMQAEMKEREMRRDRMVKAAAKLTKAQIQELMDMAVLVEYRTKPVVLRFLQMIHEETRPYGPDSGMALACLTRLVLEPLQIVDPTAQWVLDMRRGL